MLAPGHSRNRLARSLNAAYAEGVLSENTLSHRLELVFSSSLVDPASVVGDLPSRRSRRVWRPAMARLLAAWQSLVARATATQAGQVLLALDWNGGEESLLVGRDPRCDIVLSGAAVSRRHAQLTFRDGAWIIQDLASTNGTIVNNVRVGRCKLRPGDRLGIGERVLVVD